MTARAVRVLTEIAAVDRGYDYLVPDSMSSIAVGDRVRVDFNGRSVRGWVIDEAPVVPGLKPLKKHIGYGPPSELLPLLRWASWRWAAPLSRFLVASSPGKNEMALPRVPTVAATTADESATESHGAGVVFAGALSDPLPVILDAMKQCRGEEGSFLVLVPTEAWSLRLRGRLAQRGFDVCGGEREWSKERAGWPVIIGTRGAAFAPTPKLSGAVVIDCDDEAFRSEGSPTWHARDVVLERARRDGAPVWLMTMMPSPTTWESSAVSSVTSRTELWPLVQVVDRREGDPRDGVLAGPALDAAHKALSGNEEVAVAVVLQRLGNGRLFVCGKCGEVARCKQCKSAEVEFGDELRCEAEQLNRAKFCLHCGATGFRAIRSGITTLARDVSMQLGQPVVEVSAGDATPISARVVVGTEAVWQRVRRCGVVIFVDFDQYLLAPRDSATRSAVLAVGKAGRLVGARSEGRGSVIVQTRRGQDAVLSAVTNGDVLPLVEEDVATARILGLAPFRGHAVVSGEGAKAFVGSLVSEGITPTVSDDGIELWSSSTQELCDGLATGVRSTGKLRLAVD